MASIAVYEAGFLKPGPPITNAQFDRITYGGLFKPNTYTPMAVGMGSGALLNIYTVFFEDSAFGGIRIRASGHNPAEQTIDNAGEYEVWLSRT